MPYMIIDGQRVEFENEKNILAVIRKSGVDLPTFCYHSDLSTYGACRMCMVENERGGMVASCSEPPYDGMVVYTNTAKIQKYRRMILELLLASHCRDCTTCDKNNRCTLQTLAARFGVNRVRFENDRDKEQLPKDDSSPAITRDPNKCILCGDCVRVCSEIQGVGVLDFAHRGSKLQVMPAFNRKLADTDCVGCGQCAAVCPTGALMVRNERQVAWDFLRNKKVRTVATIAPAVRVALGEEFDIPAGEDVNGRIVAALRRMGFDFIFDTSLAADLTIMEEAKEFVARVKEGGNLPLFTSCCPSWVRYVETRHPELLPNVSTCKSPQQMFGSLIKEYYGKEKERDGLETVMISFMPCTAKKGEAARPEFSKDGKRDVDIVVSTQGLAMMIREAGIDFKRLEPEAPDMPFGMFSGAGVLFGVSGGVTEAVLRYLAADASSASIRDISLTGIRGLEGVKEAEITLEGRTLRVAVVSGLKNAGELIKKLQSGEAYYDFVEVMSCRSGCVGGAGQPQNFRARTKADRASGLYHSDKLSQIKRSNDNPVILKLYDGLLRGKEHELLHCPPRAAKKS